MDMYSSGEDLILKTRKPYTITKQREKWTEEEHSRFLEALKLYGRAWQRIEEHIGTKTAVQIRSHAQKFFSKLEKEALIKGVPSGQAHGIEIPPPRPKRKPNNPYPRKTSACVSSSREGKQDRRSASSPVCSEKDLLDMAGSHEKRTGDQTLGRSNAGSDDSKCSVVLSLFQDAPCASVSCAGKHPADAGVKEAKTKAGYSEQHPPPVVGGRGVRDGTDLDIGRFEGLSIDTQIRLAQERSMRPRQPPNLCASPRNGPQGRKSHPDHAPPYSVRGEKSTPGSYPTTLTSLSSLAGAHANAAGSPAPAISGTTEHNASASMSSVHHPFAAFPPFAQFGRDSGSSYLNMSSAFSSLIVSTLMQNPAVHAAATVAASFWPTADAEASTGSASESFVGGIPMRQMNPSPSMAAIAAATVAAASAWWATHGLLPFCPPPAAFHGGFAFAPAPTSAIPRTKTAYAAKDDTQRKEEATHSQPWTCPRPVDLRAPSPGQQPSPLSSSDSDESGEAGSSRTTALKAPTVVVNHLNPSPDSREVRESDIGRGQKKADRSSCGSNTPSSSDVETDVVLNLDKAMEEPKETHLGHLPSGGDASNRRLRGGGSVGESWKEVSQEGRLAFQALFSREVLPQSFSPPHPKDGVPDKPEGDAAELTMDLNSKVCAAAGDELAHELGRSCPVPRGGSAPEEGPLTDEIGQGRLKSRRTGFKPYKRCSMEAKDGRATPVEEKDNKRIRLEGEAST